MQPLIILHTNDIHGRIAGLARVATLVAQVRADNPGVPVLYLDAGDIEETAVRLSNLTKGTAMHRLASAADCQAATVGNAAPLRYGPQVLADHGDSARYPLLLANLRLPDGRPLPGVQLMTHFDLDGWRLGVVGVTAEFAEYDQFFDLQTVPALPLIRELTASLRQDGADAVIVLSHMGLPADRELAAGLQEDVTAIIGAHTHDLLPDGEWVGDVLVAQAGQYAEHLGRLDLTWDGERLTVQRAAVLPVAEDIPAAAAVLDEAAAAEAELTHFLDEEIGVLAVPLDFATDRDCGTGAFMAEVLRDRMGAEVGVVVVGQAFTGSLPVGPLRRGTLWDVCESSANPGVVTLTGAQLAQLVARGRDPERAASRPRALRGRAPGLLHLSGARWAAGRLLVGGHPADPARQYRVTGSDWEFEEYGGCADPAWALHPLYDVPTILREAVEAYLATHSPVHLSGE